MNFSFIQTPDVAAEIGIIQLKLREARLSEEI